MFKLSSAIISLIMKVAPLFKQLLITHTQELFYKGIEYLEILLGTSEEVFH